MNSPLIFFQVAAETCTSSAPYLHRRPGELCEVRDDRRTAGRCLREQDYPVRVIDVDDQNPPARAGLCGRCRFMRVMKSDRGATFYLCERSATDAAFPKYPRLPVLQCPGFEQRRAPEE